MRKLIALMAAAGLTMSGCKSAPAPVANTALSQQTVSQEKPSAAEPLPPPKYGWKVFHEETFETQPRESKAFVLPANSARLRVTVDASSAVFGGVISQTVLSDSRRILRTADFRGRPCSLMAIDKGEATCKIDRHERMVFVVRDHRAEGTVLGGIIGARVRSRSMVERATTPNKVQISLANWACVENCSKS